MSYVAAADITKKFGTVEAVPRTFFELSRDSLASLAAIGKSIQ